MRSLQASANEITHDAQQPLPRQTKQSSLAQKEERLAWLMLSPVLVALLALGVYPALSVIWLSLQQGGFSGLDMTWAGFSNYIQLAHDLQFWNALRFTFFFCIMTVSGQMILGTALALFANRKFPGNWLVRAAILCPWAIPTATNSVIWAYMFNDHYGLVNSLLERLGLLNPAHTINWLGSGQLATILIYILAIWKANALVALLVLAGLQTIPLEVNEAVRVDGAKAWQAFWYVTLPLLRPTLTVALILQTIEAWQAFDLISAFTNGAPGNSTQNLGLYIYVQIQEFGDFGYGSTISVVIMIVTFVFIILYLRALYRPGVQ
jgi:multiple sugar transport system permease protein